MDKKYIQDNLEEIKRTLEEIESSVFQEILAKKLEWGKVASREMNWKDAKAWCEEQGWRLPTQIELLQAYEAKVPGFGTTHYWSSTEGSTTSARGVNFSDGSSYYTYKTYSNSVRCVRDIN